MSNKEQNVTKKDIKSANTVIKGKAKEGKSSEFKKRVLKDVFMIIAGIVMLIAFIYLGNRDNTEKEPKDAEKFAAEYTKVDDQNLFVYKSIDEIIKILESGTGIVYLGFPSCPWCQSYVKILNETAKDMNVKEIYYYDIKEDRQNNTKSYQKIVELLDYFLLTSDEGAKRIFVPDVTFVKDGKIVAHNNETSTNSGDPDEYWTSERVTALKATLEKNITIVYPQICESCN